MLDWVPNRDRTFLWKWSIFHLAIEILTFTIATCIARDAKGRPNERISNQFLPVFKLARENPSPISARNSMLPKNNSDHLKEPRRIFPTAYFHGSR